MMPGEELAKAAGAIADPELADKVAKLKKKQADDQEHELTEIERLKIENLNLKISALQDKQKIFAAQLAAVQEEIRERLGFEPGTVLALNPETYNVRKKAKE